LADDQNSEKDQVELIGVTVTFVPMPPGAPYSLIEWDADVGSPSPPVHIHHRTDEGFYVISGTFGFLVDGVESSASTGTHVLAPKGHPHTFWNAGQTPARCLIVLSPPGFEAYFRELGPLLARAGSEADAIEARRMLSARYDIEVVGPPVANPRAAD
jgi:mannose-6-phosphate isomerase-like protein (cupin superfamily)